MLGNIFQLFVWLKDTFVSVLHFAIAMITDFVDIIQTIPGILAVLTSSISYLPSIVQGFAVMTIVVSVIYVLAGRETGE